MRCGYGRPLPLRLPRCDVPDLSQLLPSLLQVISYALWDEQSATFLANRLPSTADPELLSFFSSPDAYARSSARWFAICSGREPLTYLCEAYELHPSVDAMVDALESLLGERPPQPSPQLSPLWPGCCVGWRTLGSPTREVLELLPLPPPNSSSPSESLRLVFSPPGIHCYAVRRALGDEPRWLESCRRAWLEGCRRTGFCGVSPTMHPMLSLALGRRLMQAMAHRISVGDRVSCAIAQVAVAAAAPYDYEQRLQV